MLGEEDRGISELVAGGSFVHPVGFLPVFQCFVNDVFIIYTEIIEDINEETQWNSSSFWEVVKPLYEPFVVGYRVTLFVNKYPFNYKSSPLQPSLYGFLDFFVQYHAFVFDFPSRSLSQLPVLQWILKNYSSFEFGISGCHFGLTVATYLLRFVFGFDAMGLNWKRKSHNILRL